MRHNRHKPAVSVFIQQHSATWRAIRGNSFVHFGDHHAVKSLRGGKNAIQLLDTLLQIVAFRFKLDAAHFRQATQAQIENVLCLNLIQIKHLDELRLCCFGIVRRANHLNHLVNVDHRKQKAFNQMQTFQRLLFAEFATTANHHTAMVHPHLKHFLQAHGVWATVDQRHVIDGEIVLQRRVLEQLRQYGVRVEAGFDFNDKTSAVMAVRQVDCAGNTLQLAILYTLGNTFQHTFRADHERQFRYDNCLLTSGYVFNMRHRTRGQRATTGLVGLANALTSHNHATARPIRTWNIAHKLFQRGVRMMHQMFGCGNHFAQIVRRHICGHANGDAGTAIDEQIRDRGRQNGWLLQLVVVVRCEIHCIFGDIRVHAKRSLGHTSLGVTRCCRTVIKGSEITVAVYQRQTHGKRLRKTNHRLINRGIAMRVKLTHHLADHTSRLHVRTIRIEVHLTHLVDDAALHRLQTVSGVGQCAGIDHRIRVFEEGLAHLLVQRCFDDVLFDRTRVKGWFCRFAVRHHAVNLLTEK